MQLLLIEFHIDVVEVYGALRVLQRAHLHDGNARSGRGALHLVLVIIVLGGVLVAVDQNDNEELIGIVGNGYLDRQCMPLTVGVDTAKILLLSAAGIPVIAEREAAGAEIYRQHIYRFRAEGTKAELVYVGLRAGNRLKKDIGGESEGVRGDAGSVEAVGIEDTRSARIGLCILQRFAVAAVGRVYYLSR